MPVALAGAASYQVLHSTAQHLLQQGHSVIFDSPCLYSELLERGQQLAQMTDAAYRYIECLVSDIDELDRRLRTRPRLPSQLAGVFVSPTAGSGKAQAGEAVFRAWIAGMKRPQGTYLVLDMMRALDVCVQEAIEYILTGKQTG